MKSLGALAVLVSACSGGSSDPPAAPEPTTAAVIDTQTNPPPAPLTNLEQRAAIAELEKLPNGRAWAVRQTPLYHYTAEDGVCLLRYPHEPRAGITGEFNGICTATMHQDWTFLITPKSRIGDRFEGMSTQNWREEVRTWEVANSALTGVYTVDRVISGNGMASTWRSDRPEIEWTAAGNTGAGIHGSEVDVGGLTIGVYAHARRAKSGAPAQKVTYLLVGVETSLEIRADGSLFAQGSDGCVVRGNTSDHLDGVSRWTLTNSCAPSLAYSGFGASVRTISYIAALAAGSLEKIVIAATVVP